MVAVSRCLVVTNSRKYVTLFSYRRNQIMIIILIWIYAIALNLPSDFEVKKSFMFAQAIFSSTVDLGCNDILTQVAYKLQFLHS